MASRSLWQALSRTKSAATPRARIAEMYGKDAHGRPNTRAAAADLGVSQRTIQRWVKAGKQPSSPAGQQLSRRHSGWVSSSAGRESQMGSRREARLRKNGTTISFFGAITISGDHRKEKHLDISVTGDQLSAMLDAALQGNDRGAHDALEAAFSDAFGGASITLTPKDLNIS